MGGDDLRRYRSHYEGEHLDNKNLDNNVRFYRNEIASIPKGEYIDHIHKFWAKDYGLLEEHHGYIQWLFPIHEAGMNFQAQVLQRHEASTMRESQAIMCRVVKSYKLILGFYGIELTDEKSGLVGRAKNFKERYLNLNSRTHNNLRITRILKFLGEVGLEHYKMPLIAHFIIELSNGFISRCRTSLNDYWVHTLRDEKQRAVCVRYLDCGGYASLSSSIDLLRLLTSRTSLRTVTSLLPPQPPPLLAPVGAPDLRGRGCSVVPHNVSNVDRAVAAPKGFAFSTDLLVGGRGQGTAGGHARDGEKILSPEQSDVGDQPENESGASANGKRGGPGRGAGGTASARDESGSGLDSPLQDSAAEPRRKHREGTSGGNAGAGELQADSLNTVGSGREDDRAQKAPKKQRVSGEVAYRKDQLSGLVQRNGQGNAINGAPTRRVSEMRKFHSDLGDTGEQRRCSSVDCDVEGGSTGERSHGGNDLGCSSEGGHKGRGAGCTHAKSSENGVESSGRDGHSRQLGVEACSQQGSARLEAEQANDGGERGGGGSGGGGGGDEDAAECAAHDQLGGSKKTGKRPPNAATAAAAEPTARATTATRSVRGAFSHPAKQRRGGQRPKGFTTANSTDIRLFFREPKQLTEGRQGVQPRLGEVEGAAAALAKVVLDDVNEGGKAKVGLPTSSAVATTQGAAAESQTATMAQEDIHKVVAAQDEIQRDLETVTAEEIGAAAAQEVREEVVVVVAVTGESSSAPVEGDTTAASGIQAVEAVPAEEGCLTAAREGQGDDTAAVVSVEAGHIAAALEQEEEVVLVETAMDQREQKVTAASFLPATAGKKRVRSAATEAALMRRRHHARNSAED